MSVHTSTGRGVPQPGLDGGGGVPWSGLDGGGVPQPVLDGGGGTPVRSEWWGVPRVPPQHDWMGYPPTMTGWVPHCDWMGYPPQHDWMGVASTCYMAGGVPLAFTQEDFLVT